MPKLPKAPKKPKKSAGIVAWENYDDRVKAWKKRIAEIRTGVKKKKTLMNKYKGSLRA